MATHVQTTIRYDGPALRDHEMDVQDLAPALLALAEIAQVANRKFNGDRASLRVLVNADVKQQCFQLDLSLIQSLLDHAQVLIGKDNVTTAAEIATIIGLAGGTQQTLFGLYKWLFGKGKREAGIQFTKSDTTGVVIVNVVGDGNTVEVSDQVAALASDPTVMQRVKTVLKPLQNKDYEDFTVLQKKKPVLKISKQEAEGIIASDPPMLVAEDEGAPFVSQVDGQVEIHTAQYRGSAQWGLWWTGRVRLMKIEDEEWLSRYQAARVPEAVPGAWLDVSMEITQPRDRKLPATFVVKKVKRVLPPETQASIFDANTP